MTEIPRRIRESVLERDGWACVSCGRSIRGHYGYSIQHRTPKSMGGSRMPWINLPGNLITLCGSSVTGCHGWAEGNVQWSNRQDVIDWGYVVRRPTLAATVPVLTRLGWVLYDNDACFTYCDDSRNLAEIKDALDVRLGTTTGDRA
jgi:hypothetical protein